MTPPKDPILRSLLTRLRTAIRRHNGATTLRTLQTENTQLNPRARHMPPPSPTEVPTVSAVRAEKWSAVKLRREIRGVLRMTGTMAQEIARLGPENRVIRTKG